MPPAAQAISLWNWSFSSSNSSGIGTFTTADVTPTPNTTYQITGITGTYTRSSTSYNITGLSNYNGIADNKFQWSGTGSQIRTTWGGFGFKINTNNLVNLFFDSQAENVFGNSDIFATDFGGAIGESGTITTSSLEPATPVPLESDALPVLASAAFMAGGMWWKRKRAQAKVPELVAHKDHLKV